MVRPRRLDGFEYTGRNVYFLTACTFDRVPWFSDDACARDAIAQLLRTSTDYGFEMIAYCFMPDHLHALGAGTRADSDFQRFAAMFKQRSAFDHLAKREGRLWQEGYQEHVVLTDENIDSIAAYIVASPLRAGLCDALGQYPHLGSSRYTVEQLKEAIQMRPNWKPRWP
jgi:putative transposase